MKASIFFRKLFSFKLWSNLFAMLAVVVALSFLVKVGIDIYTHHGEKIRVPDVKHKSYADAEHILESLHLNVVISDTGYVKVLPPDCVLEQSITPGTIVKSGRTVYVVINASNTPTLTIPDVIDNSSYRKARAKLTAMGFRVGDPQYVPGEKDWVYGIKYQGRLVANGQKIPVDAFIVIQVGDGMRDLSDSVTFIDPVYDEFEETEDEVDDMQPVNEADEQLNSEGKNTESTGVKGGDKAHDKAREKAKPVEKDEFEVVTGP